MEKQKHVPQTVFVILIIFLWPLFISAWMLSHNMALTRLLPYHRLPPCQITRSQSTPLAKWSYNRPRICFKKKTHTCTKEHVIYDKYADMWKCSVKLLNLVSHDASVWTTFHVLVAVRNFSTVTKVLSLWKQKVHRLEVLDICCGRLNNCGVNL